MLHHQLPWFVGGPIMGLCVVAFRLLLNARLGVTGGYTALLDAITRRVEGVDWRALFFAGIVVGGLVFAVVAGGPDFHGYGWLTQAFDGAQRWLLAPILLASGVLIGFGAKTAQGCTSGNGLGGASLLSPASLVATATFFGTAIVVSFAIKAVI
jgi:uncharacterized membrane protein YedE/YeeE